MRTLGQTVLHLARTKVRTSPEVKEAGRIEEEEEEVRQVLPFPVQQGEVTEEVVTAVPEGTRADRISPVPSRPVQDSLREVSRVSRKMAVREDAKDVRVEEAIVVRTKVELIGVPAIVPYVGTQTTLRQGHARTCRQIMVIGSAFSPPKVSVVYAPPQSAPVSTILKECVPLGRGALWMVQPCDRNRRRIVRMQ
jgi:hypothetical protein